MRYGHLVFISLLLTSGSMVHGLTIYETPLHPLTFPGLEITQTNQTTCVSLAFERFPEYDKPENDTVLTLNVEFLPLSEADANITVKNKLTNEMIETVRPKDLFENGNVHVIIPAPHQPNENVSLEVCGNASPSTEKVSVSPNGFIGLYHQPHFDQKGSFQTIIVGENPELGKDIAIQVYVKNTGSEAVNIHIDYRKYTLEYVPLLKGETSFDGTILPNEEKTITYSIKPLRAVQILLPPAVLTYTNIFGEKVVMESTRPFLEVKGPEFNVKGAFLVPQIQAVVNEPLAIRWIAKNEGIAPVSGINAQLFVQPSGGLTPNTFFLDELDPASAQSAELIVTFSQPGNYVLGCVLSPESDPTITTNCQSATLEVVSTNWTPAVLSLLLLLIAIVIYAYITGVPRPPASPGPTKRRRFQST